MSVKVQNFSHESDSELERQDGILVRRQLALRLRGRRDPLAVLELPILEL